MNAISSIPMHGPARKSAWRFFPLYVAAAMSVVVAVNVGMAVSAIRTFPGQATEHAFDESNDYDRVLEAVARQGALGWSVLAHADGPAPALRLSDAQCEPLQGAAVTAVAMRPLGPAERTALPFREDAAGRYVADAALAPGRWDLMLRVAAGGKDMAVTRRILVP